MNQSNIADIGSRDMPFETDLGLRRFSRSMARDDAIHNEKSNT